MKTRKPVVPKAVEKQLTKLPAARAALDAYAVLVKLSNARIEKVLTEESSRLEAAAKTANAKTEELIEQSDELFGTGGLDEWEETSIFLDEEPLSGLVEDIELPSDELIDERDAFDELIKAASEEEDED